MFHKLHLKLTLLYGLFTTAILWVMSAAFLISSENSQWNTAFSAFQTDMNSLLTNLENQQTISHIWLKKMENQSYKIYLLDDGVPYLFNRLSLSEEDLATAGQILSWYEANEPALSYLNSYRSVHAEYVWSQEKQMPDSFRSSSHFASCMTFLKNEVPVTAVVTASQQKLHKRLFYQRLVFLLADLAGSALFFAFSWYFTGRLLKPVREAQVQQNAFIASASHELRTPLSVILACASACEIAPAGEQARFFAGIKREGKRMQGLISDMLCLANSQAGRFSLKKEEADLETLLLNLYEEYEPLAREKGLSLSIGLPEEGLPSLFCDPEKITQMMSVFLQNALCYTPVGGSIGLGAARKGKFLSLYVTDTGCGIPDGEKTHIFERFYRAETARSQKEHFGLGLCIAQDIVKAHLGRIKVTDNVPGGTVFTVELPLFPPDRGK